MEKNSVSSHDRINILLVDDHHENLVALSAILTNPDYRVVTALSGSQALSALLRDEFALVVLDIMMPGMDGYQLASIMKEREHTQHIPIIFLTAIATEVNHIYKGYSAGAVDYLMKPMEPEIVKAKVAVFVDLFRSKQRIKQQAEALRELERQAQETKLALQQQESEAWYSTTLRSIGDAVIATDIHGIIRFINPVAEALTGWTFTDAHGKSFENVFQIINEDDKSKVESPIVKIIREGMIIGSGNNSVLVSKNGKEFTIEDSGAPIRNEKGVLLGVVIVFRDSTEKRRSARRRAFISTASSILLSSLDYSTTLQSVAHLAVSSIADYCMVDIISEGGTIDRVALAHSDPKKESIIQDLSKPIASDPGVDSFIYPIAHGGKTKVILDLPNSDLQSLGIYPKVPQATSNIEPKSCICVPLSMRGNSLGAITFLWEESRSDFSSGDIQMVEELATRVSTAIENARLYDRAQRAIRLRDEFLSIASHELRTPITPLKLQLQTLKNITSKNMFASFPTEKLDQMFNIADRQMERFQKLIEELLDVSRISVGRLKIEKKVVDLAEIVRGIVNQFTDEIKNTKCHVEVETVPVMGNWDKLRLEQVLINLLANAMKFGAGKPIKVLVETEGEMARLKVKDHGPGISKDDQIRIFDRFERAASSREFPGLGLGLYITKKILEAHGGTISVESQLGQGATFTAEIPLQSTTVK